MEELFHYMKTLRSQMNDVADQAAKISVEEHMLCTTIQSLQEELDSVKNEMMLIKKMTYDMAKEKERICLQISEKQLKVSSLETDSSTLSQTVELMHQQKLSLSSKLSDMRVCYSKIVKDICKELKERQVWINARKFNSPTKEGMVNERTHGDISGELQKDMDQILIMDLNSAKDKLARLENLESNLALDNKKLSQSVDRLKTKMSSFKPELRDMDKKCLEKELQALLSDKDGGIEYIQSLRLQIMKLNEISHKVRCSCGEEYNVSLDL